jgi:hypothetical protein
MHEFIEVDDPLLWLEKYVARLDSTDKEELTYINLFIVAELATVLELLDKQENTSATPVTTATDDLEIGELKVPPEMSIVIGDEIKAMTARIAWQITANQHTPHRLRTIGSMLMFLSDFVSMISLKKTLPNPQSDVADLN